MSTGEPLTELKHRKRLLSAQSDLHRAVLQAEWTRLRDRIHWVESKGATVRKLGPWLGLVGAVTGLFAARRPGNLARWIPAALALWRAFSQEKPH